MSDKLKTLPQKVYSLEKQEESPYKPENKLSPKELVIKYLAQTPEEYAQESLKKIYNEKKIPVSTPTQFEEYINRFSKTVTEYTALKYTIECEYIKNHPLKDELIKDIKEYDKVFLKGLEDFLTTIKASYLELFLFTQSASKIQNHFNGKTSKSKKQEQIKAEEWAKGVWETHPNVTQEQMAIDIKDKLDLTQSIQTIIRWIKPFQPKK